MNFGIAKALRPNHWSQNIQQSDDNSLDRSICLQGTQSSLQQFSSPVLLLDKTLVLHLHNPQQCCRHVAQVDADFSRWTKAISSKARLQSKSCSHLMFGTGSPGTLMVQGIGETEATADEAQVIPSPLLHNDLPHCLDPCIDNAIRSCKTGCLTISCCRCHCPSRYLTPQQMVQGLLLLDLPMM